MVYSVPVYMAQEEFLKGSIVDAPTESAPNNVTLINTENNNSETSTNSNKTILIGAGIGIILYLLFK